MKATNIVFSWLDHLRTIDNFELLGEAVSLKESFKVKRTSIESLFVAVGIDGIF